jgi:hypothetical protein
MAKKGDEKKQQQHMNTATTAEDQQHIIPSERISLCREIGSGEFGSVFQGFLHLFSILKLGQSQYRGD